MAPLYRYTAQKKNGETYENTVTVANKTELYQHIRKEGGRLIRAEELGERRFSFAYWNEKLSTVKEHDKIIFATNLAAMVGAGLSLSRALSVSLRQTKNPKLRGVIRSMRSDIEAGKTLHDAMARFPRIFSSLFVAMVKAGEESGNLAEALRSIAAQLDRSYRLKKKIKGAMIYPSIIIIAIVGIGILMMVKVVPTLAQTFAELNAELPASTRAVIVVSEFMKSHIYLTTAGFLLFIASFIMLPKTKRGRRMLDWIAIHLPIIKELSKEINAARMARTFSSLLAAGVDLVSALSITEEVLQNHYHKAVLAQAALKVEKGGSLHEAFEKADRLFPPLVAEMIAVGEETGALPELLGKIADFYEQEVSQKTKDLSTIIEPFLMLIIGVAVGFFAVAMIMPIYSLGNYM